MSILELLLDRTVEEALNRIRRQRIVTLVPAVAVEGERRTGIAQVFDTEGKGRVIQQTPPAPTTMSFGCRCDGFFANDVFAFFVVARFWRFRSNLNWRPELVRDLPIYRGPIADQMNVTRRI